MKKTKILAASSLSFLIAPSIFADVQFNKAGYSIGTIQDQHVEFFDRDNNQFLDALTYGTQNASIFEGKENGYTNASLEAFSSNGLNTSKYISVADMNNDGFQDLITYPFRVLINNRQGHFPNIPPRHPFTHNGDHFKIQTSDLDQNGVLDLFLTGTIRANGSFNGSTILLMNVSYDPTNANQGYFSYERTILFSQNNPPLVGKIRNMKPSGVTIGDVNNDGMPDAIFLNSARGTATTSTSSLVINNGSGTLLFGQSFSDAEDIALGDLDNDGDLDAYLARSGNQADEVWFNNGQGVFTNSGQLLGSDNSMNTAMADLDGDGDLDVVTTNHNANFSSSHRIWLNDGSGQLSLSNFSFGAGQKTETFKLVDVDNDGDIDIVTLGGHGTHSANSSILLSNNEVWLNQLISDDNSSDITAAIEHCQNFPNDYGLYSQSQFDQAITYSFTEGENACQSNPEYYGLLSQANLENELLAATQQGEQNCKDNPSSCNLFDQYSIDQAIIYGLADGREEGVIIGKQTCIDNPGQCGLFNQEAVYAAEATGLETGHTNGKAHGKQLCIDDPSSCGLFSQNAMDDAAAGSFEEGFTKGKQSCIDQPESCGLFNQEDIDQANNDMITEIIKFIPKGKLNYICKKYPLSPLCENVSQTPKHIIKQIIKDLPRGMYKSICKHKSDSQLCKKWSHKHNDDHNHGDIKDLIKKVVESIPANKLDYICAKKPHSVLCQ